MILVVAGAGSYLFRFAPLALLDRFTLPPTVERTLAYAGTAAMTALVVSAMVGHQRANGSAATVAGVVALGVTGWLTIRRRPFAFVVAVGIALYAVTSAALTVIP